MKKRLSVFVVLAMVISVSMASASSVKLEVGKTEYYIPIINSEKAGEIQSVMKKLQDTVKDANPNDGFSEVSGLLKNSSSEERLQIIATLSKDFNSLYNGDKFASYEEVFSSLKDFYRIGERQKSFNCVTAHETISSLYAKIGGNAGVVSNLSDEWHVSSLLEYENQAVIVDYGTVYREKTSDAVLSVYEQMNGKVKLWHQVADAEGNILGVVQTPLGKFFSEKFKTEKFQNFLEEKKNLDGFKVSSGLSNSDLAYEVGMQHHFKEWFAVRILSGLDTVADQGAKYSALELNFVPRFGNILVDYTARYGIGSVEFMNTEKSQKFSVYSSHLRVRNICDNPSGIIFSAGLTSNSQVNNSLAEVSHNTADLGVKFKHQQVNGFNVHLGAIAEFSNSANFQDESVTYLYDSHFGNLSPTYFAGFEWQILGGVFSSEIQETVNNLNTVDKISLSWALDAFGLSASCKNTKQENWMGYSDSQLFEGGIRVKLGEKLFTNLSGSYEDNKVLGKFTSIKGGVELEF